MSIRPAVVRLDIVGNRGRFCEGFKCHWNLRLISVYRLLLAQSTDFSVGKSEKPRIGVEPTTCALRKRCSEPRLVTGGTVTDTTYHIWSRGEQVCAAKP